MPILVQKYGGTSVNTIDKRSKVLDKIIAAKNKGYDVVVVVSAMGRKGEPYATDTLLDLLQAVGPDPRPRTKDLLASCGEIISTCVVAHALEQRGYQACPMTGIQAGIETNEVYTNAQIQNIDSNRVKEALRNGEIVVLAGFQGYTGDMSVTTLGRGGSDTTAIAIGGALGAEMVEIYTDVPGVAFTDPRLVPEAPYLKSIDFYPLYVLARAGSKVVHHRAVQTAITYRRPFVVRSTFDDKEGTVIGEAGESFNGFYGIALQKNILVLQVNGQDPDGFWKGKAVDELFYQNDQNGCVLAIPAGASGFLQEVGNTGYDISEECDLLTVMWDPQSMITPKKIEELLAEGDITARGFFDFKSGGAWAVPVPQTGPALRLLFHSSKKAVF